MSKKRSKFIPISNKSDSNTFIMPGRQKCECAATRHELINNCTSCGRIVCSQEGSGQCYYCGELVCTNEEFQKIFSKSNKGQNLLQQLMYNKWPHHNVDKVVDEMSYNIYEKSNGDKMANERKERLLEFDRTSARRTKVIDDEKDYYETDGKTWIDPKNRELLKNKEKELRDKRFAPKHSQPMKFTLDLKKGQLIEEKTTNNAAYELYEDPEIEMINNITVKYETKSETNMNTDYLKFIDTNNKRSNTIVKKTDKINTKSLNRIQDRELQEIRDEGMCLSMHQPWATLLVSGIKIHEGRSWFTNHRGRLWIAATAKTPQPEIIDECRRFYINRGINASLFPESYPVGCLLGCVDVVDCLPEEDYLEMFPNGESGSPFVFICDNAKELNLKFPIKGKHKIYKLESHVHNAAKSGIKREE